MIPGGPRNERQMAQMMRKLGMTTESVDGVEEVLIRTRDKEIVLRGAEVTIMTIQGVRTYQVVGDAQTRPRSRDAPTSGGAADPAPPAGPPEEDVTLVMEQAGVEREEAIEALRAADGAPAEAILHLLSKRGPP
jgi:nascent polypeptide-associated complex subunit alpha